MKPFISFENVSFKYAPEQPKPVLDRINLTVEEGSFVTVLGHNGSGKSTLAKHLNAILTPTEGKVYVDGIDTADEEKLFELRQRVGMVFQNPDNQIVATVVEEDVAFAPENLGVPPAEIRKRVDDALEAVGMSEYKEAASYHLSGGQKQRIAIAGVLAMMPKCIVLDEPTAMLDPQGRKEVMNTIRELNRKAGITIVMITHFMNEAIMADRVVVMDEGRIVLDGGPYEVFSHVEELKSVGLDVPQTTELIYLLKRAGVDIDKTVLTDEECADVLYGLLEGQR
ncbi:MAG: energy-coupling factor transporter ATPase [Clostridia bacterium]|nr:energy-coupling factor transporter ATPase [Clostridia bacterium]MBQ1434919.1 energy-coupling factor transporter ATPase [Clostridia bacterium]